MYATYDGDTILHIVFGDVGCVFFKLLLILAFNVFDCI